MRAFALLVALCGAASVAAADSVWATIPEVPLPEESEAGEAPPEDKALAGSVELGYLATSGNSETTSLNGKFLLQYEQEIWRHGFLAQAVRATDDGALTAERYQAATKSDYKFGAYNYLFIALNYDSDEFSGYERRTSEAVGYGRRILDSDTQLLDLEIGAGARQVELVDGTRQSDRILRLAGNYKWTITETSNFSQTVAVETGEDNTYSESVTAVTANVLGALALKVSYTVKRNSEVPPGVENTDTYTSVSLLYSF